MYAHRILMIILMLLLLSISAFAQLKIEAASGTVAQVNVQDRVLDLQALVGPMALLVSKDATITMETRPATLEDIRPGDAVEVRYYTSEEAVYVVTKIIGAKPIEGKKK